MAKRGMTRLLLFVCVFCLVLTGCDVNVDTHQNELQVPLSASDCKGDDYNDVITAFEGVGFTDISTEVLEDLITGWLTSDGEVEKIAINGKENFDDGDWFSKDAKITVTYHTFPNKDSEESDRQTEAPEPGTAAPDTQKPPETTAPPPETTAPATETTTQPPETTAPKTETTTQPPAITTSPPATTPETTPPADSTFSVHFIDVGQADAALIECDGHYMLIDGGNKGDSNVIYSVLKKAGASHLDIVVGTHGHEDHIGGIPGAFNYATADLTLCSVTSYDSDAFRDFSKYAAKSGGGITVPTVGDEYALGSASVTILGVNGGNNANDTSIVLKVQYGETSFLFTGDAEREAEQAILNSGADLSATVLKVGHHGSDTSTTYPFLREIMPSYAVISVGKDNSYGHPDDNALSRLRDADVTVYRTDLNGDIVFTSDGKTVSVSTDKAATTEAIMTPGGNVVVDPKPASETTTTPPPETQPETTTKPAAETEAPTTNTVMVWIPNSGSKYHSNSSCSNMKNPTQVTQEEAERRGFTPCKKCW